MWWEKNNGRGGEAVRLCARAWGGWGGGGTYRRHLHPGLQRRELSVVACDKTVIDTLPYGTAHMSQTRGDTHDSAGV